MNTLRVLSLGCLLGLATLTSHATQTAQARLHCWSLRFGSASAWDASNFYLWDVNLTTINSGFNGELTLNPFDPNYTHFSYVDWYDMYWDELLQGELDLNVPDAGDANGNGLPDFFEVSQEVNSLSSEGVLLLYGVYDETVHATWYRAAGSSSGTCYLSIPDPTYPFFSLLFAHTFQLIEYNGALTYTPGVTTVSGVLSVANNDLGDTLLGPMIFQKSATNPANELTLETADLTNAFLQVLGLYAETDFFREATHPSNYLGSVEFMDGDPNTIEDDYYSWQLSIDDLNDSNGNGIPDFSDTPGVTPPSVPELTLTRGSGNLLLSISGDVGVLHHIERASAPSGAVWTIATSVTLTNDPQVTTLPLPTNSTFWRARVPVGSP